MERLQATGQQRAPCTIHRKDFIKSSWMFGLMAEWDVPLSTFYRYSKFFQSFFYNQTIAGAYLTAIPMLKVPKRFLLH